MAIIKKYTKRFEDFELMNIEQEDSSDAEENLFDSVSRLGSDYHNYSEIVVGLHTNSIRKGYHPSGTKTQSPSTPPGRIKPTRQ